MTMQSEHKVHDLAKNVAVQMTALAVMVVILVAVAWMYVW